MTMRLTVLTTTFNWPAALQFAIKSVLAQTWQDFEYRIVGDGCTDETADVVAGFQDPRIRWTNLARNTGNQADVNRQVLGDVRDGLIAYLNHDDLWFPEHLATLLAAMSEAIDIANTLCLSVAPPPHPHRQIVGAPRKRPDGAYRFPSVTSSVMHAAAAYHHTGGWPPWRETEEQPQVQLFRQLRGLRGAFAVVPKITVLKFHSATRRNSYRHRTATEQADWWHRMNADPELRMREAMIAYTLQTAGVPMPSFHLPDAKDAPPGGHVEHFRRQRGLEPMIEIGPVDTTAPLTVAEPHLVQTPVGPVFQPSAEAQSG